MREVIIACDFKNKEMLYRFLESLEGEKPYLKIGMELFYAEGAPLIKILKKEGYKIFLDLKLHDIPNTVHKAMKVLSSLDVDIVNVHAAGGIEMMIKAKAALEGTNTKLFAVTILTSLTEEKIHEELNIHGSLEETVKHYAINTKEAGLDGIICSPYEAPMAKEIGLMSLTPGIRFASDSANDQARVATPAKAKALGSDYIVIGRSITQANNPKEAYLKAVKEFSL